jgi:ubiquinone/menaquinone biosynthesis C-methylase UbiE
MNILTQKISDNIQERILPGLKYQEDIYADVIKANIKDGMAWLDLGCGKRLFPNWRHEDEKYMIGCSRILTGVDINLNSLKHNNSILNKVNGDIAKLPFKNCSFDLVTADMVLEHLAEPSIQCREVYRILKPGGMFILHTPNKYDPLLAVSRILPRKILLKLVEIIEGRGNEDTSVTYYRANSIKDIILLADASGFHVHSYIMLVATPIFGSVPPILLLESLWLRILMLKALRLMRPNIIAVLKRF